MPAAQASAGRELRERRQTVLLLYVLSMLSTTSNGSMTFVLPLNLDRLGHPLPLVGTVVALIGLGSLLSRVFGGAWYQLARARWLTIASFVLMGCSTIALGLDDGDYVYIDADPSDRPFRDFKEGTPEYKISRLLLRVRFYPGTPRGITRTWHNMYGATFGSVAGHETRPDGLAKSPETNYQAMYRYGSHQSATRAWLKPTLMTETLVHKDMFGQAITKGFLPDVHCPVGAPREAFVKLTKAEGGGLDGKSLWRPAALGFRPTYESEAMKLYLKGNFTEVK